SENCQGKPNVFEYLPFPAQFVGTGNTVANESDQHVCEPVRFGCVSRNALENHKHRQAFADAFAPEIFEEARKRISCFCNLPLPEFFAISRQRWPGPMAIEDRQPEEKNTRQSGGQQQ